MTTTFWIEITIMICSIYSGFTWAWIKMSERIADLEFDNHILEGENESIWQQLYAMTYGDKSEVKLKEESSLENSIKNHPSNGNNEYITDKINEHFGRDF